MYVYQWCRHFEGASTYLHSEAKASLQKQQHFVADVAEARRLGATIEMMIAATPAIIIQSA